jgi:hypothetical protein
MTGEKLYNENDLFIFLRMRLAVIGGQGTKYTGERAGGKEINEPG